MIPRCTAPVRAGAVLITIFGVLAGPLAGLATDSPVHRLDVVRGEDGPRRTVVVEDWSIPAPARPLPLVAQRGVDPDSLEVSGRVLLGDRLFDAGGYTGPRSTFRYAGRSSKYVR